MMRGPPPEQLPFLINAAASPKFAAQLKSYGTLESIQVILVEAFEQFRIQNQLFFYVGPKNFSLFRTPQTIADSE